MLKQTVCGGFLGILLMSRVKKAFSEEIFHGDSITERLKCAFATMVVNLRFQLIAARTSLKIKDGKFLLEICLSAISSSLVPIHLACVCAFVCIVFHLAIIQNSDAPTVIFYKIGLGSVHMYVPHIKVPLCNTY